MEELKPCPFCNHGGNLYLSDAKEFIADGEPKHTYYAIRCPYCGGGTAWYSTIQKAIAAWNTRAGAER